MNWLISNCEEVCRSENLGCKLLHVPSPEMALEYTQGPQDIQGQ